MSAVPFCKQVMLGSAVRRYSTSRFFVHFCRQRERPLSGIFEHTTVSYSPRDHAIVLPDTTSVTVHQLASKKDVCRLYAYRAAFKHKNNLVTLVNPRLSMLVDKEAHFHSSHSKPGGTIDMLTLQTLDARQLPLLPFFYKHPSVQVLVDSVMLKSPSDAALLRWCPSSTRLHCLFRDMIVPAPSGSHDVFHAYTIPRLQTVMHVHNLVNAVTQNLEAWTLARDSRPPVWRVTIHTVDMSMLWMLLMLLQPLKTQVHHTLNIGHGDFPPCLLEYTFKQIDQ